MDRAIWYLKQFLPFTYVSAFTENGVRKVCVWKMWLGRCYNIREWQVVDDEIVIKG